MSKADVNILHSFVSCVIFTDDCVCNDILMGFKLPNFGPHMFGPINYPAIVGLILCNIVKGLLSTVIYNVYMRM